MQARDKWVHFVMSQEELERMQQKMNWVSTTRAPTFEKWRWLATASTWNWMM